MLKFCKNAFRNFMEVILWINLISCAIGGGVVGYGIDDEAGHAFLGIIIGVVFGIFYNILFGGFISVILNIDKNLETLKRKVVNNEDEEIEEVLGKFDKDDDKDDDFDPI